MRRYDIAKTLYFSYSPSSSIMNDDIKREHGQC